MFQAIFRRRKSGFKISHLGKLTRPRESRQAAFGHFLPFERGPAKRLPDLYAEISLPDGIVGGDLGTRAGPHDVPMLHDVDAVGYPEGGPRVLLDQ